MRALKDFEVRLARLSTLGIYASAIYVFLGFPAAYLSPGLHAPLIALTIGLLFPLSISLSAFVGPLRGGRPRRGLEALASFALTSLALASPPLGVVNFKAGLLVAMVSLIIAAAYSIGAVIGSKRREPRLIFYYPPLAGSLFLAYAVLADLSLIEAALGLGISYPVSLIFSFSSITMTRNYVVKVTAFRVLAPILIHAASIAALVLGFYVEALLLLAFFMLSHFVVMGYYRFPRLIEKALSMASVVNRRAYIYIVSGHTAALIAVIAFLVFLLSSLSEGVLDKLIATHMIYMGFIGLHIYLHAPLMAPFIAEVGSARRYNPSPLALLLLATITRPTLPTLSFLLAIISLAALLFIIKPAKRV